MHVYMGGFSTSRDRKRPAMKLICARTNMACGEASKLPCLWDPLGIWGCETNLGSRMHCLGSRDSGSASQRSLTMDVAYIFSECHTGD